MADQQETQAPTLEELPKVQPDLKDQLEHFNPEKLKNVEPQEKVVLPTAEGAYFSLYFFKNGIVILQRWVLAYARRSSLRPGSFCLFWFVASRENRNLPRRRNRADPAF